MRNEEITEDKVIEVPKFRQFEIHNQAIFPAIL